MLISVLLTILAASELPAQPLVGAIRWDAWNEWGYFQQFLVREEWRVRRPFFTKTKPDGSVEIRCDSQEVMDQEIAYAHAGELDYWTFVWYHPDSMPGKNHMTRCLELYLASAHKQDVRYCLTLLAGGSPDETNHLGAKDKWPATTDYLVERFKDPFYQKVMGNRPLVYFFETEGMIPCWGSEAAARGAWDLLRKKTIDAGLGSPYIAGMVFHPKDGVALMDKLGLDAISAYANPGGNENIELPYAKLCDQNRWFWNGCVETGRPFIPTVNVGWDYRPEKHAGFPYRNDDATWFTPPSPAELAGHVQAAMRFVREHPAACPANAVVLYAWNEFNEGGWLAPTLQEGTTRLDAVKQAQDSLKAR